jgi:hypothetical protein
MCTPSKVYAVYFGNGHLGSSLSSINASSLLDLKLHLTFLLTSGLTTYLWMDYPLKTTKKFSRAYHLSLDGLSLHTTRKYARAYHLSLDGLSLTQQRVDSNNKAGTQFTTLGCWSEHLLQSKQYFKKIPINEPVELFQIEVSPLLVDES